MYVLFPRKLIPKIRDGKFIERKFWNIFLYKVYKMGKMYEGWNTLIEIILKVSTTDDNKSVNTVKIINSFKLCFICIYDLLNTSKLLVWDKSMIFTLFACMVIKNWGFVGFFFLICVYSSLGYSLNYFQWFFFFILAYADVDFIFSYTHFESIFAKNTVYKSR